MMYMVKCALRTIRHRVANCISTCWIIHQGAHIVVQTWILHDFTKSVILGHEAFNFQFATHVWHARLRLHPHQQWSKCKGCVQSVRPGAGNIGRVWNLETHDAIYLCMHTCTLHHITLLYVTLHCIGLHYITLLHCIAFHCVALLYTTYIYTLIYIYCIYYNHI
jgi:hypothetical protein